MTLGPEKNEMAHEKTPSPQKSKMEPRNRKTEKYHVTV